MTILQVVGRKVVGLENPLRLDVVGFQDVTQESRDVARPRDAGCRAGGEQNCDHQHGLGHVDQVRASNCDFREHNGLV